MAKTNTGQGVMEAKTTAELKRELQRMVQRIVDEHDYALDLEATDRAMQTLCSLKELTLKLLNPQESRSLTLPPPEFRCPLSGQLMIDPVVIASGQVSN